MRQRPFLLFFCANLFLYFPLELFWRWQRGYDPHFGDLFLSLILPIFMLYGLLRVAKYGWYTLIAFTTLWGMKDIYVYYASHGSNIFSLIIHVLIYAASLTYFINPRVRPIYFDPKMRWWRTKPRNETHTPAIIKSKGVWSYPVIRNISEGGCFLESNFPFQKKDEIEVAIPLPIPLNISTIMTRAEVRWVSDLPGRDGAGVQFNNLSPEAFRALKKFVAEQL